MDDDEDELGWWPQVNGPFLRVTRWRDPPLKIVAVRRTDDGYEIETKERA